MEMTDPGLRALKAAVGKLQQTGAYSDFTITCSGHVFRVHKFLLLAHSPVLYNMATNERFTECQQSKASLEDDQLDCVKAMIDYMYTGRYCSLQRPLMSPADRVRLAIFADKYAMEPLQEAVNYDFSTKLPTRYLEPDLDMKRQSIIDAVHIAYQSHGATKSIRTSLCRWIGAHVPSREDFQPVFREYPEFALEVLERLADYKEAEEAELSHGSWYNHGCNQHGGHTAFKARIDGDGRDLNYSCPHCGEVMTGEEWFENYSGC